MKAKIVYCEKQLEETVKFICSHNRNFLNQEKSVRESIKDSIIELVSNEKISYISTIGYLITVDVTPEGIDCDEDVYYLEFLVDPALGKNKLDLTEEYVALKPKGKAVGALSGHTPDPSGEASSDAPDYQI